MVKHLDRTFLAASYGMEIGAEKTKLVTNNAEGIRSKLKNKYPKT